MDTWTDKKFSNREFSTNSKKSKHTHIKQINLPSNIIEFTSLHDGMVTDGFMEEIGLQSVS